MNSHDSSPLLVNTPNTPMPTRVNIESEPSRFIEISKSCALAIMNTIKKIILVAVMFFSAPIWLTVGIIVVPIIELYHLAVNNKQSGPVKKEFKHMRDEMKEQIRCARFEVFEDVITDRVHKGAFIYEQYEISDDLKKWIKKLQEEVTPYNIDSNNNLRPKKSAREINKNLMNQLKEALSTKEYKEYQENKNTTPASPAIKLIQELCYQLYVQEHVKTSSHAMLRFTNYINESIKSNDHTRNDSLKSITEIINDNTFENSDVAQFTEMLVDFSGECSYDRNTIHGLVHYLIMHPRRTFHSLTSEKRWIGVFNPVENGNPIMPLVNIKFSKGDKNFSLRHIMGSTQTVGKEISPLFLGFLDACVSKKKHFMEAHLQAPHGEEFHRVEATFDLLKKYPNNLNINVNTVNGKMFQKGKGLLMGKKYDPNSFHKNFQEKIMDTQNGIFSEKYTKEKHGGIGYYIPEKTEQKKFEVQDALDQTLKCLQKPAPLGYKPFIENLSNERKARIHQYLFQIVKDVGQMVKTSESKGEIIFMEHCKEDIDRGATKNMMTTYVMALIAHDQDPMKNPMNHETMLKILSPVLTRAQAVGDRLILKPHLEAAIDILRAIPKKDLLNLAKDHLQNIGSGDVKVSLEF